MKTMHFWDFIHSLRRLGSWMTMFLRAHVRAHAHVCFEYFYPCIVAGRKPE